MSTDLQLLDDICRTLVARLPQRIDAPLDGLVCVRDVLGDAGFRNPLHLRRTFAEHDTSALTGALLEIARRLAPPGADAAAAQTRRAYDEAFDHLAGEDWLVFMNHGLVLPEADDTFRRSAAETLAPGQLNQARLYLFLLALAAQHTSDGTALNRVLDIGCGRGGGLRCMVNAQRV